MYRMLVLQSLYNLSDGQVQNQVRNRLSFTRFLGLGIEDGIPDGTTLWLFRETLAKAGLVEKLFERFGQHLEARGYIARGGQMVDATIVPVPKQRNSRDENDEVKAGKTPEAWEKNPAKNRQKDKDARWTKKHGKSFYGYKNHVNADAKHKLIRQYDVTDASVHDSQKFDGLLNQANTSSDVYADSAYRSAETEAKLGLRGLRSRIHLRANRNHPLSQAQQNANRRKSRVRARIEHVFGAAPGIEPVSAETQPVSGRLALPISDIENSSSRDSPRDSRPSARILQNSSPETGFVAANLRTYRHFCEYPISPGRDRGARIRTWKCRNQSP